MELTQPSLKSEDTKTTPSTPSNRSSFLTCLPRKSKMLSMKLEFLLLSTTPMLLDIGRPFMTRAQNLCGTFFESLVLSWSMLMEEIFFRKLFTTAIRDSTLRNGTSGIFSVKSSAVWPSYTSWASSIEI